LPGGVEIVIQDQAGAARISIVVNKQTILDGYVMA
jgi:hypothetical protein